MCRICILMVHTQNQETCHNSCRLYGSHPATWASASSSENLSALKGLHHEVDDLSEVLLVLKDYSCVSQRSRQASRLLGSMPSPQQVFHCDTHRLELSWHTLLLLIDCAAKQAISTTKSPDRNLDWCYCGRDSLYTSLLKSARNAVVLLCKISKNLEPRPRPNLLVGMGNLQAYSVSSRSNQQLGFGLGFNLY